MIADALSYPFRGAGLFILILGTVAALLLQLASFVPILGFLAIVLLFGYFTAYYYQVLQHTATGSDAEPDWPDVSDFWDDLIRPLLQVIGVLIVANLPWALAIAFTGSPDSPISLVARIFGMFYFPMALLAVVVLGHLGGANPLLVIPSILRTFPGYAVVAAIAILLPFGIDLIIDATEETPWIAWGVSTFLSLYLITTHARLLGLFYRRKEEALDWI